MKRKEAKKGYCEKCKKYFYLHDHHIKPKSIFGEGKKAQLCPNCHTHVHEYMNLHLKNPNDEVEVLKTWDHWFKHVSVTFVLLVVSLASVWWLLRG